MSHREVGDTIEHGIALGKLKRKLNYLSRFELLLQMFSVIVIGTLLGAAYAVTMKIDDRRLVHRVKLELGKSSIKTMPPKLSSIEKKTLKDLNKKILFFREKSSMYDLKNSEIESKIKRLTVKNKVLASQLRDLDDLVVSFKKRSP